MSHRASPVEARLRESEAIALGGAGNSAGQAVAFLAPRVKHRHLAVSGESRETSMSPYLIERINALSHVTPHTRDEITAMQAM